MNEIIIAVLVIFITLVFYLIYKRTRGSKRGILLMGISDSGKTLTFSQLLHSKFVNTHTSVKENVADLVINNNFLRIVDIPGHERLRSRFFDQYKTTARGVVYIIDSTTLANDIRDVAEFLYTILSDDTISQNVRNLLVLCNKQDQSSAKNKETVRSILENEINTLRVTKISQLQSVDPAGRESVFLGKRDKDFDFSQISITVEFAEAALHSENSEKDINITELTKWLEKIV